MIFIAISLFFKHSIQVVCTNVASKEPRTTIWTLIKSFETKFKEAGYESEAKEWNNFLTSLFTSVEGVERNIFKEHKMTELWLPDIKNCLLELKNKPQILFNSIKQKESKFKRENQFSQDDVDAKLLKFKTDIVTKLLHFQNDQKETNQLCVSILQKLEDSIRPNSISINTNHNGHKILQTFSDMQKWYSDFDKKVEDASEAAKRFFRYYELVMLDVRALAYLLPNSKLTRVWTQANMIAELDVMYGDLDRLEQKTVDLKRIQDLRKEVLVKVDQLFGEYIDERYIWAESLQEYIENFDSKHIPLLIDEYKKIPYVKPKQHVEFKGKNTKKNNKRKVD